MIVAHTSLGAANLKELIALLKANPGKFSYSSPGTGTPGHLAGELFKIAAGVDIIHVPFIGRRAGDELDRRRPHADQLSGAVDGRAQHSRRQGSRARGHGVRGARPRCPTCRRLRKPGLDDQEADVFVGILLPAGTPRPVVDLLHREIVKALALPDVKERLAKLGFDPIGSTPDEFAAWIKTEVAKWAKVIRDANIKMP